MFVTLNSWLLQDCPLYIFQGNLPDVALFHLVLQTPPLQKKLLKVSFLRIYRTTTLPNNFFAATLL